MEGLLVVKFTFVLWLALMRDIRNISAYFKFCYRRTSKDYV